MTAALISSSEKPLVTFVIFAYNQAKYIQDAIDGAFAQDYEPLEIILSDDCSTDNTFELMKNALSAYRGPHRVICRQSVRNRGTLNHVLEVAECMNGGLMILAAGDDVSYPHRAATITNRWIATGASAFHSAFDIIDEEGHLLQREITPHRGAEVRRWFASDRWQFVHGATSAYSATFFAGLPYSHERIFNEDAVFSFLVSMDRLSVCFIDRTLIGYRQHDGAWSNALSRQSTVDEIKSFERKISDAAESYPALCDYCLEVRFENTHSDSKANKGIKDTARFAHIRRKWISASAVERCMLLATCRSWREVRFLSPRLFGLNVFATVKAFIRRLDRD